MAFGESKPFLYITFSVLCGISALIGYFSDGVLSAFAFLSSATFLVLTFVAIGGKRLILVIFDIIEKAGSSRGR